MTGKRFVDIPHLGGITAAYQASPEFDPSKPTVAFINSMVTSSDVFRLQLQDAKLLNSLNMIAIDQLGHGDTKGPESFTAWDAAVTNLQVLESLEIDKFFVVGSSQGGWIGARMALMAPQRVKGFIPMSTSMDYESDRSQQLGCWNCEESLGPVVSALSVMEGDDFEVPKQLTDMATSIGVGSLSPAQWPDFGDFWEVEMRRVYNGKGRQKLIETFISVMDRDGLHRRLPGIIAPVLWIHGDEDTVFSVENIKEGLRHFANSPIASYKVVKGGKHFVNVTHPKEVNEALLDFVQKYA
jgi:pimeloyl-ACP methyl ester carboxylesterase